MSVINKKPLIEKVVSALSPEQKKNLLKGLNGELTKSVKVFDNLSTSDKGISYVDIKFTDGVKTGYLVYNDAVSVLIAYYNDTQKMTLFVLDITKHTYKASREYLTIDELRRIVGLELVEVGENIKIQVGDIDSGSQAANKIIVSDGEGGASWGSVIDVIENADVEDGSAQYLIGIDSNGDVVKDEIPEGIVVDRTIVEDSTNAVSGGAVYDALELKADSSDVYTKAAADELLDEKASITALENGTIVPAKSLVAEQLENVSEDSGTTQDAPFVFQATATDGGGGASDTAPTAKYLKLKGRSYAFNQLVQNGNFVDTSGWGSSGSTLSASNNKLTLTTTTNASWVSLYRTVNIIQGHKYLVKAQVKCSDSTNYFRAALGSKPCSAIQLTANQNYYYSSIVEYDGSGSGYIYFYPNYSTGISEGATLEISNVQLFDLTQLFNGDIPDAILNGVTLSDYDLSFSGVDIFNQLFPLPYYAYNEGTLVSANATLLTTIGKNQCNGIFESGTLLNGEDFDSTTSKRTPSSQIIKVIPKQLYQFIRDVSGNAFIFEYDGNKNFIKRDDFTGTGGTKILQANCHYVRLVVLNEVSKVDFSIYWDGTRPGFEEYVKHEYQLGDELKDNPLLSAGNVCDEKTPDGVITRNVGVETLDANKSIGDTITISGMKADTANVSSGLGALSEWGTISGTTITLTKALSSGSKIHYELATPTTTQGTPFSAIAEVDDMGTMGYGGTSYNGYPQGCEFFYPADYVLFIDSLGNACDFDPSKIALKSDVSAEETARTNYDTILQNAIGGTLRQLLASSQSIDFNDTDWVDLGTLDWNYDSSGHKFYANYNDMATPVSGAVAGNILCPLYKTSTQNQMDANVDKIISCIAPNVNHAIYIRDTSYTDVTAFKNAMKGVLLAYEKASS